MDMETLAYLGLGVSTFALVCWRSQKSETTFGSAEWLQPWVASRKGMFRKGGLVLGDWIGLSPVHYRGTGHALNVLAAAFPRSTFVGYDLADDGIALAQAEAEEMGLDNVSFAVMDVTHFPTTPPYDLIMAFDTVHDLAAPDAVLNRIREALAPNGAFLMVEFKFSSLLEENIGNPFAPMYYGFSLLHCTPVSLYSGGSGLGAVWGEQTARRMLADAGFHDITVVDTPRPQNYMFLSRR